MPPFINAQHGWSGLIATLPDGCLGDDDSCAVCSVRINPLQFNLCGEQISKRNRPTKGELSRSNPLRLEQLLRQCLYKDDGDRARQLTEN
ncbi:hypothetical protein chiPu_0018841 [Chiloscyllium punctatum]|uniref:Uncharacterized protein n=1 Tax=Chiloscyllium punctatum TaxID=137246 RepID=A0A401RQ56_CHIPU|nr:hypothetical protein [Chiloscyllium punctatum]